jgi:hypothetical protein
MTDMRESASNLKDLIIALYSLSIKSTVVSAPPLQIPYG